eukprot:scaffold48_cov122-Skeletonema_menzelii.AAC.2
MFRFASHGERKRKAQTTKNKALGNIHHLPCGQREKRIDTTIFNVIQRSALATTPNSSAPPLTDRFATQRKDRRCTMRVIKVVGYVLLRVPSLPALAPAL